ncbi:hypothetical protein Cabys_125 [Caldithrix abyssi DSM 13497]|uniref:Uncharacterized protein n=1 Tax=Caldithrix abyssi DSM 13497 TaxID=880073 RepID=A0A1J1C386_CALAY|nr:hypothetical protein Cabys_125 [Caldithrix abyssi DSM 13497]
MGLNFVQDGIGVKMVKYIQRYLEKSIKEDLKKNGFRSWATAVRENHAG